MANKLTTKTYWEQYYKHSHANAKHIVKVCSYYDKFWSNFFDGNCKDKTLIEIGGFPGRYLAYLSHTYNVIPTCLDYNSNQSQIEETFKVMKIKKYDIIQADFTTYEPTQEYDFVISNGFIEHFDDFNNILDQHVKYLKPGGKMLVMIPNKRYLRKWYGLICDNKNLKAHNLKSMSIRVFKNFAQRNNLKIDTLQYYGGFPYTVHQKLNIFQKMIYKSIRIVFKEIINPILMNYPSKYLSNSIIFIAIKN